MKVQLASLFKTPALELVSVTNENGAYAVRLSSPRDPELEDCVVTIGPERAHELGLLDDNGNVVEVDKPNESA